MELDLQSLLSPCGHLYSLAETLHPLPPHLGLYTRALLVSQDHSLALAWRSILPALALQHLVSQPGTGAFRYQTCVPFSSTGLVPASAFLFFPAFKKATQLTPCLSTLKAMDWYTPCMFTLLVVDRVHRWALKRWNHRVFFKAMISAC